MANKTGYTGALDANGAPILQTFVDNGDGTWSLEQSASGGSGGSAVTIADGADVAQGALADAAVAAGATGSVSAKLRSISRDTGALTETAPATDTASSGLNGRLQRIAQRLTSLIALFPTALGGTTSANSLPVVLSSDGPFAVQTGSITETAPATDTASSGLNGRLQRIAQRLTTLLAVFPATIDTNSGAKSASTLRTVHATDDTMLGALTETAPATDTASSGLNGRLQRIAQNLSTLFGRFVAAATLANGTTIPSTTIVGSAQMLSNGVTLDMAGANQDVVFLTSASRSTVQTGADLTNPDYKGIILWLNVTVASGTGGLTYVIDVKDPGSGTYTTLIAPTAVTATGLKYYTYYPGISAAFGTSVSSYILPRTFRLRVAVGDASSYTYTAGYTLLK